MYFKPILPIMFLLSRTMAFHSENIMTASASRLIMRMKKTSAYDSESISNSRKSKNIAPLYRPRSDNQKEYVSHLKNPDVSIVFGIGPAGCGKTLFACTTAIESMKKGAIQKIVLTRPIVPVEEEELGFLPGTLVKKMDPWTRPLMDIFLEYYPKHELDFMLGSGVIEISPLAYMRGRTFKHCFIIADEMQNSTPNQMLMLTTRIGEGSKMAITGDLKQSDRCLENGLLDIMEKIRAYRKIHGCDTSCNDDRKPCGIEMVEMNKGDIERSPIVSKILEIYNQGDNDFNKTEADSFVDHNKADMEEFWSIIDNGVNQRQPNADAALIPIQHISKHQPPI